MNAEAFLSEFQRIIRLIPKIPTHNFMTEDCDFGDMLYHSKNMYDSFDCSNCTDSTYLFSSYMCANCMDVSHSVECELCYECTDSHKCYNSSFLENCATLRDSSVCFACTDCHDVFGCVNLKNKSFCIFNRQLSENEYREQIKKYKNLSRASVFAYFDEFKKLFPWTQTNEAFNDNTVYGNYMYHNKNSYLMFDSSLNSDTFYAFDSNKNDNCADLTQSHGNNLCYECVDCVSMYNSDHAIYSGHCTDCSYLFNCSDLKNCLFCVNISHKEFCILNRQLDPESYARISAEILKDLRLKNPGWADIKV